MNDRDAYYARVGRALTSGFPIVACRMMHDREHPDHDWKDCPDSQQWLAIAKEAMEIARQWFPQDWP